MEDTEMKQEEEVFDTQHSGPGGEGAGAGGNGGAERQIQVHPLVVMNIADHYTRQKRNFQYEHPGQAEATMPQVIGGLFGIQNGLDVAVYDSFEMKYDVVKGEVQIDKEFLTSRIEQFAQVFPGFELLGWYTVGSKAQQSDLAIHRAVMEFNESPLFMLLDPTPQGPNTKKKLPISLYESELHVLNGAPTMIFVKTQYKIETSETEGISVDHISKIAPMADSSKSSLHPYLGNVRDAIKMLHRQSDVIVAFLQAVKRGEVQADHNLLRHISSLANQLPALSSQQFDAAFLQEYNDTLLVSYLATLTKGATNANTVIERFALTQDRQSSRGNYMT
ncbi:hypothetical protein Poli38472_013875 [Pythium oligandrum]|uniref:COP9 signalosome complex subunit 6 n=1 Tax=Pythium oligandrum TaxID=41045 RepID=A0A8K1C296_PYTOL|nr:hypothetical protein Poli38472_013875 [Pythium oligandrum]|eukprot:TMW55113.1 hypothetical protein Poli38472_013875 [Pythium oligandrum]